MLRPHPKVLVTGFDPFGDAEVNPSWLVASALHGRQIAGHRIVGAQLPTVFGQSARRLAALLKLHRPSLVVCLGLAAGRAAISLERVAININDARIPDNHGAQPVDSPVAMTGPSAYFARYLFPGSPPAITSQPVDSFACMNAPATFVATAAGDATYQWQIADPLAPEGWSDLADGELEINGATVGFVEGADTGSLTFKGLYFGGTARF